MRVYLLARELGYESKTLITFLNENGFEINNHMNNLDEGEIKKVRELVEKMDKDDGKKGKAKGKAPKASESPAPKPSPKKAGDEEGREEAGESGISKPSPKKAGDEEGREEAGESGISKPSPKKAKDEDIQEKGQDKSTGPKISIKIDAQPSSKDILTTAGELDDEKKVELLEKIKKLKGKKKGKRALKAVSADSDEVTVEELPPELLEEEDDLERAEDEKIRKKRRADEDSGVIKAKYSEDSKKKKATKAVDSRPKIQLPPLVSPKELADLLQRPVNEVIQKVMALGIMSFNQKLDFDISSLIAEDFGFNPTTEEILVVEVEDVKDDPDKLVTRPPVVTVMGHVDHGKTTLLDSIRKANVASTESGGITQHIGAYRVHLPSGNFVAFIDTPGHEAFTAMRAHGASVTDIAILVVAADDGVQPQTIEAISHARAAGVPIIVALNKTDKPGINTDRVLKQLADNGLAPEEWGGSTVMVRVSALTGEGISELIEMIELMAEMRDLKANPQRAARGVIIESFLDKGKGPVATVLVQNGCLKSGDPVVIGPVWGRVRSMHDENGNKLDQAGPSTPVEIFGLSGVPGAGDQLRAVESERIARETASAFEQKLREKNKLKDHGGPVDLNELFAKMKEDSVENLNVIIKADVDGSVAAIKHSLEGLSDDKVKLTFIHGGVGAANDNDVLLASTSGALILAFRVRESGSTAKLAVQEGVTIKHYKVIYEMHDDVKAAMKGMLAPVKQEVVIGHASVRRIYKISRIGTIAGSYVEDGKITRNSTARVVRDGISIYEGRISSLKRFQDDSNEVLKGFECGIGVENFDDIKVGDTLEFFKIEEVSS